MKVLKNSRMVAIVVALLFVSTNQQCYAHFPWLTVDESGHALLFFSESPTELDYKLPAAVSNAEVAAIDDDSESAMVKLVTVETDELKGRRSKGKVSAAALTTSFTYGNYHGTLLKYYAQHLPPVGVKAPELPKSNQLQASVAHAKTGIEVSVAWQGKPLKGAGVTIIDAEGETFEDKSDADGKVSFSTQAEGMTAFIIGHSVKPSEGEWQGEPYTSESYYCTVTTEYRMQTNKAAEKQTLRYAPLPEGVASFGAAVSDGELYVYSGHTGMPHTHSLDNLSKGFHRLKLDGQSQWESLAMQTPLQGLPLVAHAGKLYRVGGLHSTNAADEEANMTSVDEFACYDPKTNEWMALPNLPAGRSSHDAVVLDGKLYVLGGWTLSGDNDGEWLEDGCVFDLANPANSWQPILELPFRRRALAVAHWNGKIIAMGGMTDHQEISVSVDCYDPATNEWSKLADFPSTSDEEQGYTMSGFGVSAWNTGDKLYASGSDGIVYRLNGSGDTWDSVGEVETPRFFHRLLASNDGELLILGGAPLEHVEHLSDIEVLDVE